MKEVSLYGKVVPYSVAPNTISLLTVQNQLDKAKGDNINLKINCTGGDIYEAFAIYSEFRRYADKYKAKIFSQVVSNCDCIGTVMFLCGNKRYFSRHIKPFAYESLIDISGEIDKIALHFSDHTELRYSQVMQLIKYKKQLSADDTFKYGFSNKKVTELKTMEPKRIDFNKVNRAKIRKGVLDFKASKFAKTDKEKNKTRIELIAKQIKESKIEKVVRSIERRKKYTSG